MPARARATRRAAGLAAALSAAVALAACGTASDQGDQSKGEPTASFPVQVQASFPTAQTLSQHTHLVITVHNTGSKTIPNVAITVCPVTCHYPSAPGQGTSSAVFDSNQGSDSLDNPSTPLWVVDHPPGPCKFSCRGGGGGSYSTSNPDTWASGALAPGHSVTFDWGVTAVTPGHHVVAWQVAAGLAGNAKAVLAGGGMPQGTFAVNVATTPAQSYVDNNGNIVTTPGALPGP